MAPFLLMLQAAGLALACTGGEPVDEPAPGAARRTEAARPAPSTTPPAPMPALPQALAAELRRVDDMHQAILATRPIEQWRFEAVRAGYQELLKRAGESPGLEEALRARLGRVAQHEQAAKAARTIEAILAKSHERDGEIAEVRRDLARVERARARGYDAVGFIQASARRVDGRKVFALIGSQGSRVAYLDIPPGLDPQPFLAHRIGVRGQVHYDGDLGSRLITVRDIEDVQARK